MVEETLEKEQFIGTIDPATITPAVPVEVVPNESVSDRPGLHSLLSVQDFEDVARRAYSKKTYAFYSSAATDLISHHANLDCYRQLLLRPRILRNVKEVSIRRSILGCESSAPFFVSPVAMAKLAHPDGELAIARGCGAQNITYIVRHSSLPGDNVPS